MKNRIAVCFFSFFLFIGIAFSAFAQQEDLKKIQDGVKVFSEGISKAIPFNSLIGLNWSDAYIGKLFPGAPPHFGAGISLGATTMDPSSIKTLASNLDADIPDIPILPLPAYTVEARLGGFALPFDIGFKFGYLPPNVLPIPDINLNYILVGGDIRYAVIDGVANKALPNVSVGVGVNYLKEGLGAKMGQGTTFTYQSYTIDLTQPVANLEWNTTSLELKAQISKTIAIITPYFGVGGSYSFSNAGYSVDAKVKVNGGNVTQAQIDDINQSLISYGLDPIDITADGISSFIKNDAFNLRAFGGFSLNLAAFRLDLTGLFNVLDQNFGATLGLRFQL